MNWIQIENTEQIEKIREKSHEKLQLIFKHSIRCFISKTVLKNFENDFTLDGVINTYYLDLIVYRDISNKIADDFGVIHQSPQILLIKKGKVIYKESHEGIDADVLKEFV